MPDEPLDLPPMTAQLDYVGIDDSNHLYVRVRFDDGAEWQIEWTAHSEETQEIFDFFSELATRAIAQVAGRGVVITDFTPPEDDDE
jgi:hypothetical protein